MIVAPQPGTESQVSSVTQPIRVRADEDTALIRRQVKQVLVGAVRQIRYAVGTRDDKYDFRPRGRAQPAQLDIMHVREIATIEFILVSSHAGLDVSNAMEQDYIYVDWGLSFALDHRRTFPNVAESMTRVSHAKMAMDYITSLGGSAYLPRRMVRRDIELGLLHEVADAPSFERQAYACLLYTSDAADD